MSSRIRTNPNHVFDMFCEVAKGSSGSYGDDNGPFILHKYPESFEDDEIIKSVPQFVYPCQIDNVNVIHFSFVLTSVDSKWTYGFVRHSKAPSNTCLVMLSSLPWHDTFYKVLNFISNITNKYEPLHLNKFLDELYNHSVPDPGSILDIKYYVNAKEYTFDAPIPDHLKLPSIPEDRNLTEFFNAINPDNMIALFASMLNERRIVIVSSRLSRLTACVQAANSLIYPMSWQHIFIPVLPTKLIDYLSAPMPFLIGIPAITFTRVKKPELGDIVILDADSDRIETPYDDVHLLPTDIIQFLKRSLKSSNNLLGDSLSRCFLQALVRLIGGYRDGLSFPVGQKITFNEEAFVRSRAPPIQPFLEKMLQLQIFQQFIEGRLLKLHEGEGFNDEFELELNLYESKSANKLKMQYKEWYQGIKKEGSAMLKSVNPAVKSAYRHVRATSRQVRDKGKQAYRGIKSKINERPTTGQFNPNGHHRPRSAPSSPSSSPVRRSSNFSIGSKHSDESGGHGHGMKKSKSGFVVPTTNVVSYVRPSKERSPFETRQKMPMVASCNDLLDTNFDSMTSTATEPVTNSSNQRKMIDFDLLNEVDEAFSARFSIASDSTFKPFMSSSPTQSTCKFESSFNPSNVTSASLIANTSRFQQPDQQATILSTATIMTPDDLIKLESPPEEQVKDMFDPLSQPPPRPSSQHPLQVTSTRNGFVESSPARRKGLPPPPSSLSPFRNGDAKKRVPGQQIKASLSLFEEFALNPTTVPIIPSPLVKEMMTNDQLFDSSPFEPLPSANFPVKSNGNGRNPLFPVTMNTNNVQQSHPSTQTNSWQKFE